MQNQNIKSSISSNQSYRMDVQSINSSGKSAFMKDSKDDHLKKKETQKFAQINQKMRISSQQNNLFYPNTSNYNETINKNNVNIIATKQMDKYMKQLKKNDYYLQKPQSPNPRNIIKSPKNLPTSPKKIDINNQISSNIPMINKNKKIKICCSCRSQKYKCTNSNFCQCRKNGRQCDLDECECDFNICQNLSIEYLKRRQLKKQQRQCNNSEYHKMSQQRRISSDKMDQQSSGLTNNHSSQFEQNEFFINHN